METRFCYLFLCLSSCFIRKNKISQCFYIFSII